MKIAINWREPLKQQFYLKKGSKKPHASIVNNLNDWIVWIQSNCDESAIDLVASAKKCNRIACYQFTKYTGGDILFKTNKSHIKFFFSCWKPLFNVNKNVEGIKEKANLLIFSINQSFYLWFICDILIK